MATRVEALLAQDRTMDRAQDMRPGIEIATPLLSWSLASSALLLLSSRARD